LVGAAAHRVARRPLPLGLPGPRRPLAAARRLPAEPAEPDAAAAARLATLGGGVRAPTLLRSVANRGTAAKRAVHLQAAFREFPSSPAAGLPKKEAGSRLPSPRGREKQQRKGRIGMRKRHFVGLGALLAILALTILPTSAARSQRPVREGGPINARIAAKT